MVSLVDDVRWPVRTPRLVLRPAEIADADVEATWRIRQQESVGMWLSGTPASLDEHRSRAENPEWLAKTLIVELDGQVVGDLMVAIGDAWAQAEVADQARGVQAELGWVLDPDVSGRGLATEAVQEVVRICFEDLGLRRVTAECFAANEASWRLMERVGMRREAHAVRESLHRTEGWLDGFSYALLADEWRKR
jgi:RimJ/RimL family protein N-acetyltransferase